MRSDFRYSIFLCYNTFPFPKISDEKKQEIEEVLLMHPNRQNEFNPSLTRGSNLG